jgi:threonine dehydratase
MVPTPLTLQGIRQAAQRIQPYIRRTPLLREQSLDKILACQAWLKPEMLQITGAFKLRGALNKVLSLTSSERQRGIIATSSGNHGQACAYVGQLLGIHATVVLPDDAPAIKIENARAMGAEVILTEREWTERWQIVLDQAAEHGYTIVTTDDDYTVLAGQGTVGLEILADLPDVGTVLAPIGGGGLISGVSTVIKELNPNVRVIGAQAAASCVYYASRQNGSPTRVTPLPTLADGLTTAGISPIAYPIIEKYVDDIVIVEEEDIKEALRVVARHARLVAEPSACVGIAALLSGRVKTRPDEKVCSVLTGGNWDLNMIGKILKGEQLEGIS